MSQKPALFRVLFVAAALSCVPATALAQSSSSSSSTATTQGDTTTTVFNPNLSNGTIELSDLNLKLESGWVRSQGGEDAARLRLSLGHPIYIFGKKDYEWDNVGTFGWFKLKAGGSAEIDISPDGARKLQLEAPSLAFIAYNNKIYSREEIERVAREKLGKSWGDVNWNEYRAVLDAANPTATTSINLAEAVYKYGKDKSLGSKQNGVELTFVNFDVHKAFKVNGLPMDFCLYARPIGVYLGESEQAGKKTSDPMVMSSVGTCMGARLGALGELKGGFDFTILNAARSKDAQVKRDGNGKRVETSPEIDYDDTRMTEMKITAELNKILNSPIGVGYEYSISSAQSGGDGSVSQTDHRHFLKVHAAF